MKRIGIINVVLFTFFCLFLTIPAFAEILNIPANVKIIEEEAFFGDENLSEVVLPEGVEKIGERAFARSSVKRVTIPESCEEIAESAFEDSLLEVIIAPEGSTGYIWADEHGIEHGVNDGYPHYKIVSGLPQLKLNLFESYDYINVGQSIQFTIKALNGETPERVEWYTSLHDNLNGLPAKHGNGTINKKTGVFTATSEGTIGIYAFCFDKQGIGWQTDYYDLYILHDGIVLLPYTDYDQSCNIMACFGYIGDKTTVWIPDKDHRGQPITYINSQAFSKENYNFITNDSHIENLIIPSSVTKIGSYLLTHNNNIKTVYIMDSGHDLEIGTGAFRDCPQLEKIYLPDSVKSLGEYGYSNFYGCSKNLTVYVNAGGRAEQLILNDDEYKRGMYTYTTDPWPYDVYEEGEITGTVASSKASPIQNVIVTAVSDRGETISKTTDVNGAWTLSVRKNSTYAISYSHPDYTFTQAETAQAGDKLVAFGIPTANLGSVISGTVKTTKGEPVPNVVIIAISVTGTSEGRAAVTDKNGNWMTDVDPLSPCIIVYSHDDYSFSGTQEGKAGDNLCTIAIKKGSKYISGVIKTASDEPVVDALIRGTNIEFPNDIRTARSGSDGAWAMEVAANTVYEIEYEHPAYIISGNNNTAQAGDKLTATANFSGPYITFCSGSDFIGTGEEVTSAKSNGDIVSRIGYPLTPGMELAIPFRTHTDAQKVTVKLRYWNEEYQNYYTFFVDGNEIAASTTDFQMDASGKTGTLLLKLPEKEVIRTGLYVLQIWSKDSADQTVDARVKIKIKGEPWIGYVQADRLPTYEGPTGAVPKGKFVDNMDPVLVLEEDETRYKIEMVLTDGGTDIRWVDKDGIKDTYMPWNGYVQGEDIPVYDSSSSTAVIETIDNILVSITMDSDDRYQINGTNKWIDKEWIKKKEWVFDGKITNISIDNDRHIFTSWEEVELKITTTGKFDFLRVGYRSQVVADITADQSIENIDGYIYTKTIRIPMTSGIGELKVTPFRNGKEGDSKDITIYVAENILEILRSTYTFTVEETNNTLYDAPLSTAASRKIPVGTRVTPYGAYPSCANCEYFLIQVTDSEGNLCDGFIRTTQKFTVSYIRATPKECIFDVVVPTGFDYLKIDEGYASENVATEITIPETGAGDSMPGASGNNSNVSDDTPYISWSGKEQWTPADTYNTQGGITRIVYDEISDIRKGSNTVYYKITLGRTQQNGQIVFSDTDEYVINTVVISQTSIHPSESPNIQLSAVGLTNSSVRLSWESNYSATWVIYRSTTRDSEGQWEICDRVDSNARSYLDTHAVPGCINYYYIEDTLDITDPDRLSSNVFAIYPLECPRLPIMAYKVADKSDEATIMWDGNIPIGLKAEVYWCGTANGNYQLLADNLEREGGYVATHMPSDGILYFKLRYYREDIVDGSTLRSNSEWDAPVSLRMNPLGSFRSLIMCWEDFQYESDRIGKLKGDSRRLYSIFRNYTPDGLPWIQTESPAQNNLNRQEVHDLINWMAGIADETDITWVHIATHGGTSTDDMYSGSLLIDKKMEDGSFTSEQLTLSDLADWLNGIPGRVVVSFGSCGSGSAVFDSADIAFAEIDKTITIPNGITYRSESFTGKLRQGKFYVMTGSIVGQPAVSTPTEDESYSHITKVLQDAFGEGHDKNKDGIIQMSEMYTYLTNTSFRTKLNDGTITEEKFDAYPAERYFELLKPTATSGGGT